MKYLPLLLVIALFSCGESEVVTNTTTDVVQEVNWDNLTFEEFTLDTAQHYRGLYQADGRFYITGSDGHVVMRKGTNNFTLGRANGMHLRDVHYSDEFGLTVLAIAKPSGIYVNDLDSWEPHYEDSDSSAFIDGMDFWANGFGLAYGDPTNETHYILKTKNQDYWERIPGDKLPTVLENEAGFAASGTGIVCLGEGTAYVGFGGSKARLFKTTDYGDSWSALETPIAHGKAGKGIYCAAFKSEDEGVVAGGDWENAGEDSTAAYTNDGGQTWTLSTGGSGYRSGICHVQDAIYFSVGTNGVDMSLDNGATWKTVHEGNYNAIQADVTNRQLVAVGSYGQCLSIKF